MVCEAPADFQPNTQVLASSLMPPEAWQGKALGKGVLSRCQLGEMKKASTTSQPAVAVRLDVYLNRSRPASRASSISPVRGCRRRRCQAAAGLVANRAVWDCRDVVRKHVALFASTRPVANSTVRSNQTLGCHVKLPVLSKLGSIVFCAGVS